jgi:hypothetical protein
MPIKTTDKLTHDDVRNANLPQGDTAKEFQCPVCGHGHLHLFATDGIKCQNGCDTGDVAKAIRGILGTGVRPRFASDGKAKKPKQLKPSELPDWQGFQLDMYCGREHKRLDRRLLETLYGAQELTRRGKPVCGWPYFDADGKLLATKIRLSSDSHDTYFEPADPHVPYGLSNPHLRNLVPQSYDLFIVEGESDCHTLGCWGFIAIGISGSQGWLPEFADLPIVQNAKRVFISEDQKEGTVFVAKVLKDLPQAFILRWPKDVNDPSDLHLKYADSLDDPTVMFDPNPFVQAIDTAIQHATLEKAMRQPKTDKPKPTIRDEAFYGLAGEVVRLLEPVLETDRPAILSNFLSMAGVLFQHDAHSRVTADIHYPADYYLTVGPSAVGRKGTTTNAMLEVIERVQPGFKARILSGLSTGQGLIVALMKNKPKDSESDETTPEDVPEAIPEAIASAVMVEISEFSELLAVMKREENTLTAVLRNAWDGRPLAVLTRKQPLKVQNVSIAQVAHITVRELLPKLTSTDRANGFANRYLFVWSERVKLLPKGDMSHVNYSDVVVKLHKAMEAARNLGEVKRDPDAEELWAEEYKRLTARGDSMIDALLSRADAHVVRLSLLYALLDGSRVVRVQHLRAAIAFWDYCEASVRFVFDMPDATDERILRKLEDGPLTTAEIRRLVFNDNKEIAWVADRMAALEEKKKVRRGPKEFKTKTVEAWYLRDGI